MPRDFNYVDDVVRVLIDPEPARHGIVNIGSGVEASIVSAIGTSGVCSRSPTIE
jgi:nucleoside-diphosphate-sugar epimerase